MKQEKMIKVLAFGTFDLFHEGHKYYLSESKKLGDILIVDVARDLTVKKVKGFLPNENETMRLMKVMASGFADEVVLGDEINYYDILKKISPNIICLGYDQTAFIDKLEHELKKIGLNNTKIVRINSFKPEIYKSSKIREQKR